MQYFLTKCSILIKISFMAIMLASKIGLATEKASTSKSEESSLKTERFCKNLQSESKRILGLGHAVASESAVAMLTEQILATLKEEKLSRFISLNGLITSTDADKEVRYLDLGELLARVLEIPANLLPIFDVNELKYLPYTLEGISLLIITADEAIINQRKAALVTRSANAKDIKVSVLWTGGSSDGARFSSSLFAGIAADSRGRYFDLGALKSCTPSKDGFQVAKNSL